jgi:CheY-like chemotaxis protein
MYAEFLRYAGLTPVITSSALPALRLALDVDIIVTGLLLPGPMDGIELVIRLKSDNRTKDTPIIVLTSCAWDTERARAERAGCDLFLGKPCLPQRLLHEVRRLLATSQIQKEGRRPAKATLPARTDLARTPKRSA